MKSMISADSAMKQAKVQGSVANRTESSASVLKAEIKQDKNSGTSTEKKEEALAKLEERASSARGSQMSALGAANAAAKDAQAAEAAGENPEEKEEKGRTAAEAEENERRKQEAARKNGAAHVDLMI